MKHLEEEMKVKILDGTAGSRVYRSQPELNTVIPYILKVLEVSGDSGFAWIAHDDDRQFADYSVRQKLPLDAIREWTPEDELHYLRALESELLTALDDIQKQITAIESAS